MYLGQIVFSQLMDFLPKHEFAKCVQRYRGNYCVKKFSCFSQFLCMAFAQLTYRESLRDIETCRRALQPKLYHAGIRSKNARSTVELFFKWIKQHLRIKSFYGTSVNAVKTQIWIAISVFMLVAIVKKELNLHRSLNDILQILSITIFEKSPIYPVFSGLCSDLQKETICNQWSLFNN